MHNTYGVPNSYGDGFSGTSEWVFGVTEVIAVVCFRQMADGEFHDKLGEVVLGSDHVHVVFAALYDRRAALRVPPEHHFRFRVGVHHALQRHAVTQVCHGYFRRHQFRHICKTYDSTFIVLFIVFFFSYLPREKFIIVKFYKSKQFNDDASRALN